MKKFLLGSVALAALGIGAPAIAADMAVRPVAPVRAFSWTGCHIGGLVGYEWGHDDGYSTTAGSTVVFTGPTAATPVVTTPLAAGQAVAPGFDMNGFTGGGYAGCDYQFGSWVVGAEGDWSVVNKEGQSRVIPGQNFFTPAGALAATSPVTSFIFGSAQERWYATARARVGYAVDKWLFFVSGGAAWTKIDDALFQTNAGPIPAAFAGVVGFIPGAGGAPLFYQNSSNRRTGWTVGAGVDYAPAPLMGNWTVRAEYLYVHFDDYTAFGGGTTFQGLVPTTVTGNIFALNNRFDNHIVRFGLAYKIGPTSYRQFQ
jgi:outer membrane immunogenic protein